MQKEYERAIRGLTGREVEVAEKKRKKNTT